MAKIKLFLSYCHKDEEGIKELQISLIQLRREGIISSWSDHQIKAGARIDAKISQALEESDIFIAFLSRDYIASPYCYETEFETARNSGKFIVPVIYRPCDWLKTGFSEFKAVPRDGKPVTEWLNQDSAWLDITQRFRDLLKSLRTDKRENLPSFPVPVPSDFQAPSRVTFSQKPRIALPRNFTSLDKKEFAKEGFLAVYNLFKENISVVADGNPGWSADMDDQSNTCFSATLYRRGSPDGRCTILSGAFESDNPFFSNDMGEQYLCYVPHHVMQKNVSITKSGLRTRTGNGKSKGIWDETILELFHDDQNLFWQKLKSNISIHDMWGSKDKNDLACDPVSNDKIAPLFWKLFLSSCTRSQAV